MPWISSFGAVINGAEINTYCHIKVFAFSAPTLLVACQQEHPACKNIE